VKQEEGEKVEIVWQNKDDKMCGQCCVAMITGKPLGEIIEKYGHNTKSYLEDAKRVLEVYGYQTGDIVVVDNRKHYELPELAFVRIERLGRKNGHFVVHYKGKFYDSCEGVFESSNDFLAFYRKRKWRIRHFVEVIKPQENTILRVSGY
jgi:hypothetical protein